MFLHSPAITVLETFRIINQPADETLQTETFANVVDLPSLRSLYVLNLFTADIFITVYINCIGVLLMEA